MHTPLCRHAAGEPREYAARAVAAGLVEIGFSDHSPMRRDDFDNWRMKFSELEDYVGRVEAARREFPSLTIRLGLEVDYLPGHEDWIKELAGLQPWDYLIGSVHYVNDTWDVDNPAKIALWRERSVFEVWSVYFDRLAQAAASGLFDIIGHADLAKKFGFLPAEDCGPLYARFAAAARQGGATVEINTAGLRKECREMYPSPALLAVVHQAGVPVTFGSDAHAPGEVGMDFAAAMDLARMTGYTEYQRFAGRRAQSARL